MELIFFTPLLTPITFKAELFEVKDVYPWEYTKTFQGVCAWAVVNKSFSRSFPNHELPENHVCLLLPLFS